MTGSNEHKNYIYLHIGNGKTVRERNVIGIFDMDTATVSPTTRKYLRDMERSGRLDSVKDEIPKSFVLVESEDGDSRVYIAQLSSKAVLGRAEKV